MRTDALIIEGPEGYDPTTEEYDYPPMHRQIKTLLLAKPFRVLITGDKSMKAVVKKCTRLGADFYYPGVLSYKWLKEANSFFCGLKYLREKCDRILIVPANYPFVNTETYRQVMDSDAELAVASYNGERGWPVLISTALIPELLQLGGLDALLEANEGAVAVIETDDVGVTADVCADGFTAEREQELVKSHSLHKIHPSINLSMSRENAFYGRGMVQILRLADETKVLLEVWRMMGMAANHGWKIIRRMQKGLEKPLIDTARGRVPVATDLTDEGREYAMRLAQWFEEGDAYLRKSFEDNLAPFFDEK